MSTLCESGGDTDPAPCTPGDWDALFHRLEPERLLLRIERRMSSRLRAWLQPEDVLQEAWLSAWKGRAGLEWRGFAAFRNWFISTLEHRIRDLAIHEGAVKRGGGVQRVGVHRDGEDTGVTGTGDLGDVMPATTTPSRVARFRERAERLGAAISNLPESCRGVVELRWIEECSTRETAERLALGESTVKHRLRQGLSRLAVAMDSDASW